MPIARPEPVDPRVIAHVDLDCFYVQVEQRRHPELKDRPTAVVMYNPWKGGGIIAVGYEARGAGVTRQMRGDDARKKCPNINLVQVPTHFGKADLTVYRDAGSEVVAIFSRGGVCERASIDEVYLDLTEAAVERLQHCPPDTLKALNAEARGTHIIGLGEDGDERIKVEEWLRRPDAHASRSDQLLACGATIVAELRTAVKEETGFTTSAGIAHNKMLAKLASGMHKPAQQTLIPSCGAPGLLAGLPVKKIKGLGGKLGKSVEDDLGVKMVGDLLPYPESRLQDLYGSNTGTWLWRVARGMNGDEVAGRTLPKSHGCGKTFPGPKALKDLDSVAQWLSELSGELQERLDVDLEQNNRSARLLVCSAACHLTRKGDNPMKPFPSKSCAIRYGKEKIASDALQLFKRALNEFCPSAQSVSPAKGQSPSSSSNGSRWGVTALGLAANNIVDASGTVAITQFFGAPSSTTRTASAGCLKRTTSSPPASPSFLEPAVPENLAQVDQTHTKLFTEAGKESLQIAETIENEATKGSPSRPSGEGSTQASGLPLYLATAPDWSSSASDGTIISDQAQAHVNITQESKRNWSDLSRHHQSHSTYAEPSDSGPEGREVCTEVVEGELTCTPNFGPPGHRHGQSLAYLELPQDGLPACSLMSTSTGPHVEGHPAPYFRAQKTYIEKTESLNESGVISCSPLEYAPLQVDAGKSGRCESVTGQESPVVDARSTSLCQARESISKVPAYSLLPSLGPVSHEELSRPRTPSPVPATAQNLTLLNRSGRKCLSNPYSKGEDVMARSSTPQKSVSTGPSRKLTFQRVDELWEKSKPAQQAAPTRKSSHGSWNYKQDEIDEGVLSELPEDIQHEVRRTHGLKRQKTGKSSISHFFKPNSSPTR